jgi:two-component system sensor histidine kinase PilS (NtrC family)
VPITEKGASPGTVGHVSAGPVPSSGTPAAAERGDSAVSPNVPISRNVWIALRLFNLYRLIVAGLFTLLGSLARLPPAFGDFNQQTLAWIAGSYLFGAIVLQIAIERRVLPFFAMRNLLVSLDVAALVLIMHASGGPSGGYGVLLVVAIAGACLVSAPRASVAFAAIASLAVLAETAIGHSTQAFGQDSYTQAGLLGIALFATALLSSILATQVRRSEQLAAERALAIDQLSRLNEYVVQRMRSGIMVLGEDLRIVLSNAAARRMLGGTTEPVLDAPLREAFLRWGARGENRKTPLKLAGGEEVILSFSRLGEGGMGDALVFLEDAAEIQQRAQQIKLASLGRLTVSIAHEIRNPLGAISQAGQLLAEDAELTPGNARLAHIVVEQSGRVNEIIKNVLTLGRRQPSAAESFALADFVRKFAESFRERHALEFTALRIDCPEPDLQVQMDPGHLDQVLWNLCDNALRHGRSGDNGMLRLTLRCGVHSDSARAWLDVEDAGPGMTDEVAQQIFEPFFTGGTGGTGLGLYLSRELCEANQASLSLVSHGEEGSCFRILFPHPDRQLLSA